MAYIETSQNALGSEILSFLDISYLGVVCLWNGRPSADSRNIRKKRKKCKKSGWAEDRIGIMAVVSISHGRDCTKIRNRSRASG